MTLYSQIAARDTQSLPDLSATVEQINDWVRVARPVIKAYYALDDIHSDLISARFAFRGPKRWNEPQEYDERAMEDAARELIKPRDNMLAIVEGIRSDCISDHYQSGPGTPEPTDPILRTAWDVAEDEAAEFNEAVERNVISVDAALKIVAGEL